MVRHKDTGRLFCGLLLLALLLQALPACAAETADTPKRVVRISCGINNALYLDEDGKAAGYCADYIGQLAWSMGWTPEYVEGSWTESVQNLYDGKIDLLFPTQKTADRMDKMGFSDYIGGYQPIGLFARDNAEIYYDDFESFDGKKVAISEGTSNAELLESFAAAHGFSYTPVNMNTTAEKLDALRDGEVDLVVFSTLNDVEGGRIVSVLDYLPFYYCTRIDDAQLLAEVNAGMRGIMVDSPNIASDVYNAVLRGKNTIAYTRAESETIAQSIRLRVGMYAESLPLSGVDASGKCIGIYAGLLEAIQEESGIEIEMVAIPRSEDMYAKLDDGTVDFVIGSQNLANDMADTSNYRISESIMDYVTVAITRPEYSFDEDDQPVFALTNARKYWLTRIENLYPSAKVVYFDSAKDCLAAVQAGKAEVTLLNTWEYNYHSKNPRFADMMEWENLRLETPLVLGTTRAIDETVLSIMDKAIDRVAGQEKDSIITTNLNMAYQSYDAADRLYSLRGVLHIAAALLVLLGGALALYIVLRRRHVRELEAKNEQLCRANAAKTSFLSRMSHELRTPLNAINGYAQVMDQRFSDGSMTAEKGLADSAAIQRAARYLLAIISDILDIQQIEAGRITLARETVDATVYMRDIVAMIQPEADEKRIAFSYERLTSQNESYLLDSVRFQQVLLNVLHNAIKFTPEGGSVRMTAEMLNAEGKHANLRFVISDSGIGMSREFVENRLFQNFAQENQGVTSPYGGCGTGLAISRELLRQMDGEITCESEKGRGSTFTILIHAETVPAQKRRRARRELPPCDLGGVRVLLFEDNPMNQDMERQLLEKLGCTVEVAENGKIGCRRFAKSAEGEFSVVLMDIRMPEMDGLEAARTIRDMPRDDASTIPIFAVSANAFEEDVQKSLDAGMNEHLAKPMDVRIIHDLIQKYLAKENGHDGETASGAGEF